MDTGRRYFLSNFAVILAGARALWAGRSAGNATRLDSPDSRCKQ